MPLKLAQAKTKTGVLGEIQREYKGVKTAPPRIWKEENFNFKAPSAGWLKGLMPLAALNVQLKSPNQGYQWNVYLVGQASDGSESSVKVGTISE